jgi:hypothetical protein
MAAAGDTLLLSTGLVITGLLAVAGFLKKLRNDRHIGLLLAAAFLLAISGFFIPGPGFSAVDRYHLVSPFVYMALYGFFRWIYKLFFGVEPTYNRSGWYDPEEGRKQNFFDVLVFVLPLLLAVLAPAGIAAVLNL